MKKYVLIVITFMSLSAVAMEEKKQVASEPILIPLHSSPKHDVSKRHLHIVEDIYGRSLGNDGVSPTAYFELGKLASIYPHPSNCMR